MKALYIFALALVLAVIDSLLNVTRVRTFESNFSEIFPFLFIAASVLSVIYYLV